MPRLCTVCQHPERIAIDQALVAGDASYRDIAGQFCVSRSAVERHKATHLLAAVVQAQSVREVARADQVLEELHRQLERLRLLSDACDRELRDPDYPDRYNIGPRAGEVLVTYEETIAGETVRTVAPLSVLLARAAGAGRRVVSWETTSADPRVLLLKTAVAKGAHVGLIVDVLDRVHNAQEAERFEAAVLEAIAAVEPAVRDRIVESLRAGQKALERTG